MFHVVEICNGTCDNVHGMDREKVGWWGERLVAASLQQSGFVLLDHRYRKPWGELDLVMFRSPRLHFIEVKTALTVRGSGGTDMAFRPEFQVTDKKLESLRRTGETWQHEFKLHHDVQIDVAAVSMCLEEKEAAIEFFWRVG